jgi:oxepin-CoA hydrolase/3-oxo-5,6-dehydrosuberyl-CoA semialdehyde dehydrogenase
MSFFTKELPLALEPLTAATQPQWGTMTAKGMLEHLHTALSFSLKPEEIEILLPDDKIARGKAFLMSDHPMPKNFPQPEVFMSSTDVSLSFEAAKEQFLHTVDTVISATFETGFQSKHPQFGFLNGAETRQLHLKHITHHFTQFNLL